MPPRLVSDDGRHVVIRPLVYARREPIWPRFAEERAFPILPCNLCGSQDEAQRKQMKALLTELERKHPTLRQTMLAALGNVVPTHLLDRELTGSERAIDRSGVAVAADCAAREPKLADPANDPIRPVVSSITISTDPMRSARSLSVDGTIATPSGRIAWRATDARSGASRISPAAA